MEHPYVVGRALQVTRFLGVPTTLALSVTSANVLTKRFTYYRLWSSVDAFFRWGTVGVTATTVSNPLTAKLDVLHYTDDTNLYIAGIVSSGTGTLFISEFDPTNI